MASIYFFNAANEYRRRQKQTFNEEICRRKESPTPLTANERHQQWPQTKKKLPATYTANADENHHSSLLANKNTKNERQPKPPKRTKMLTKITTTVTKTYHRQQRPLASIAATNEDCHRQQRPPAIIAANKDCHC